MNSLNENNNKEPIFLHLKAKTWNRDSHGLFDYENTSVKLNNITTAQTGCIIRRKHDVKFLISSEDGNINNADDKELFKIIINNSTL